MKIRPVGAEFFLEEGQEDRQTDMTKLTATFRSFWNAPKNVNVLLLYRKKSREHT